MPSGLQKKKRRKIEECVFPPKPSNHMFMFLYAAVPSPPTHFSTVVLFVLPPRPLFEFARSNVVSRSKPCFFLSPPFSLLAFSLPSPTCGGAGRRTCRRLAMFTDGRTVRATAQEDGRGPVEKGREDSGMTALSQR